MNMPRPHAGSRIAQFLDRRVLELRPITQSVIAEKAGFANPNMLTMMKQGSSKVPLDRVPQLAAALEVDPRYLFRLAIEQDGFETRQSVIEEIFGTIVSRNELGWIQEIRDASNHTDPALTIRTRVALRAIFGR